MGPGNLACSTKPASNSATVASRPCLAGFGYASIRCFVIVYVENVGSGFLSLRQPLSGAASPRQRATTYWPTNTSLCGVPSVLPSPTNTAGSFSPPPNSLRLCTCAQTYGSQTPLATCICDRQFSGMFESLFLNRPGLATGRRSAKHSQELKACWHPKLPPRGAH